MTRKQMPTAAEVAAIKPYKDLLREALKHITDKPWDDPTHLHDRISDLLGLPRAYPDHPRDD